MARMISNVIKVKYFGKRMLRGVDFSLTYQCDLKCIHCFNKTLLKRGRKMEIKDYARVIREAEEMGAINFAFQGGEISLIKNFEEYLQLVDWHRNSLSITSNGFGLTEERISGFKALGVNTLTISLDSGIAEQHDHFRGQTGSFAQAIKTIDSALEHGIQVVINSTISPTHLRSAGFRELLRLSEKKDLMVNTIFATPSGKWASNKDVVLSDEDLAYYHDLVRDNQRVVRDLDAVYDKRGCPAATESIYITPYGDVLPCPFIHISAGNIHDESLAAILERAVNYYHNQPKCLISENRQFIDQYIKITQEPELPLPPGSMDSITAWNADFKR